MWRRKIRQEREVGKMGREEKNEREREEERERVKKRERTKEGGYNLSERA